MDVDQFVRAGLYRPSEPGAEERLELLEHLLSRGFAAEDIIDAAQRIAQVTDVAYSLSRRPQSTRVSASAVAANAGVPPEEVLAFRLSLGLPIHDPDLAEIPEGFAEDFALYAAACEEFGRDRTLGFARVVGTAVAAITEAGRELFASPLNLDPPFDGGRGRVGRPAG
jgi:hypothetical protein